MTVAAALPPPASAEWLATSFALSPAFSRARRNHAIPASQISRHRFETPLRSGSGAANVLTGIGRA
jgi:hypothetical protein